MTEVLCARIRLREGSLPLVEEWARTLNERRDEVMETLEHEGVTVESAFLERTPEGDFLIYYMRVRDLEEMKRKGEPLHLPIQRFHRAFKDAAWLERTPLRLLVDLERS